MVGHASQEVQHTWKACGRLHAKLSRRWVAQERRLVAVRQSPSCGNDEVDYHRQVHPSVKVRATIVIQVKTLKINILISLAALFAVARARRTEL